MTNIFSYINGSMLIVLLFLNTKLISQEHPLYFKSYSIEEGLSQNTIYSIIQDKKGFIWLATQNGLNRFNGYTFKVWNHDIENPNSLISGFINSLAVDRFNNIWIATITGINCFVQEKNYFRYFNKNKNKLSNNYVKFVFIDSKNYLWAGTQNGLNRTKKQLTISLNDSTLQFIQFTTDSTNKSISNNNINCIYEDENNCLWIGTQNGLNKYNSETKEFEQYFFTKNNTYHKENDINSIVQLKENIFWIATKQGLFELNSFNKKVSRVSDLDIFKNQRITGNFTTLFKESKGNVWIGTQNTGIILYNSKKNSFSVYKKDMLKKHSLNSNYITSIYVDRSSTVFIGSRLGLNTSKTNTDHFETFNLLKDVTSIAGQSKDSVWIGTFSGNLELFNPEKNTFKYFNIPGYSGAKTIMSIYSLLPDSKNQIWIGSLKSGLFLYNYKNKRYKHFMHSKNKNSISANGIFSLAKQGDSILWIGTWGGGVDKLNLKTGIFKNFCLNKNTNDKNKVLVSNIMLDDDNNLWIATWGNGLIKLNTNTFRTIQFKNNPTNRNSISSNYVLVIYFDNSGNIWLGTASGLNKFNLKTQEFSYFGKNIGFKNEFINSIEEDSRHNLWLSTNRGIVKFNITKETVVNFDVRDGLQNYEFNSRANTKLADGKIIFGGISGFNMFYPDSIRQSTFKPNIVISKLQLFYKDVVPGKKYLNNFILKKNIEDTDTLILNYKNNVIGIEFTALDYTKPDMIKYAFRLKGFEENWNQTTYKNRFARYTNLSSGNYILQIKATNADGVWNNNIKELVIIIEAPIWLTVKFWVIIVLVLILSGIIIYKIRTNMLIKQKKLLENLVKIRTEEIENKNSELKEKYEEILTQEEEIREQAAELQNLSDQLREHNESLSKTVKKRTFELERALEKAENAQKMVSSFLANLSHEIRTPMNAIMGFAQIIGNVELNEKKEMNTPQ
ncbi:MAG: hypothetical protein L3J74_02290 [Bacteroidales bacterium]|nr:hypothetical protein [Bacteroidales bacterium]